MKIVARNDGKLLPEGERNKQTKKKTEKKDYKFPSFS